MRFTDGEGEKKRETISMSIYSDGEHTAAVANEDIARNKQYNLKEIEKTVEQIHAGEPRYTTACKNTQKSWALWVKELYDEVVKNIAKKASTSYEKAAEILKTYLKVQDNWLLAIIGLYYMPFMIVFCKKQPCYGHKIGSVGKLCPFSMFLSENTRPP